MKRTAKMKELNELEEEIKQILREVDKPLRHLYNPFPYTEANETMRLIKTLHEADIAGLRNILFDLNRMLKKILDEHIIRQWKEGRNEQ
jgi:hypothetical protein